MPDNSKNQMVLKLVKPKLPPALKKAQNAYFKAQDKDTKAIEYWYTARDKVAYYDTYAKKAISVPAQKHYKRMRHKWANTARARHRAYDRVHNAMKAAKAKYDKVMQQEKQKENLANIASEIEQHNSQWRNEGMGALYLSDGSSGIVYIASSDSESETTQSNITSYPVDKDAPRENYARESSRTVSLGGIITGTKRAHAMGKFNALQRWQNNNKEVTYQGDFYYTHLLINSLQQSYDGFRDNIKVTIGLTFVYPAEIGTQRAKKKGSKGSKHVAGNRHKRYTSITIRRGDTLWAYSQKYHKSISWLAKVNHIRNPNLIYAGRKIRVR